jgi:hypothetical protein
MVVYDLAGAVPTRHTAAFSRSKAVECSMEWQVRGGSRHRPLGYEHGGHQGESQPSKQVLSS